MMDFLVKLKPQGASNLSEACKRFALTHRQKGVCIILSDFFDKGGYEAGLRYVSGGKYDLFAVQILSPQEIDPDLQGDLKLRDVEDDDMAEVSITQPLMKQYKANLNAYCLAVKDYITRRGGTYLFASSAVPFDTLVLNYLRERGSTWKPASSVRVSPTGRTRGASIDAKRVWSGGPSNRNATKSVHQVKSFLNYLIRATGGAMRRSNLSTVFRCFL